MRWARVVATTPTGDVMGFTHADERGEFLLVITDGEPADVDQRDPQYLRRSKHWLLRLTGRMQPPSA